MPIYYERKEANWVRTLLATGHRLNRIFTFFAAKIIKSHFHFSQDLETNTLFRQKNIFGNLYDF